MTQPRIAPVLVLSLLLAAPACGDDADASGASTTSTSDTSGGTATGPGTTDATGDPGTTSNGATTGGTTGGEGVGCNGQSLLPRPAPDLPGPWPVGVRTASIGRLTVEVWYPALPGSEAGASPEVYDIRKALPESEQGKIPDDDNPWQTCACYRDLPPDDAHGPYPVVYFVHGTAGFRTQSLSQMTHWASRGFVVLAADHPGLWMADMLLFDMSGQDLQGDLDAMTAAVLATDGDLAFLAGLVDPTRTGMAGHSAGGNAVGPRGDDAEVIVPMAAGGVSDGARLASSLVLGAQSDQVVAYAQQVSGYESTPEPKRLVGLANTGHLAFSDLCALKNDQGQDLVEIAVEHGVMNANLAAGFLWDCEPSYLPPEDTTRVVNFATAAVFEETLMCDAAAGAALDGIMGSFPTEVGEFRKAP
ncbi:MAG: hypothetical protein D6705_18015 [Deltaproteobacteria bacterium]|nr:MAG: hypothetical protein D6705_18015 [Deltaproteobacteria bacterium]